MEIKKYENLTGEELIERICQDLTINESKIIKKDIVFRNQEEAELYFEDILKIHDNILVKCLETLGNYEESEEYSAVEGKLVEVIKEYVNFPNLMLEKLKNQKSNQKGCGVCKSSINRDYFVKAIEKDLEEISSLELDKENYEDVLKRKLQTLECPVCKDNKFVITETDEVKYKSLSNKVKDSFVKVQEERISYELKHGQKEVNLLGYRFDIQR